MKQTLVRLCLAVLITAGYATSAFAQGGATASLSGTVTDASGAVIPGADVRVKNNATAAESSAVSAENGTFSIPALNAGTYTVTVTLMGFKTVLLKDVVLNAGVPASVKAVMEVGGLEETITVQGGSEVIQTQSATVATTMSVNQISKLPLTSRNALDFVANMAGTNTPGGVRDSTVNGLPQSAINITLDGMNIQDNYLKTTDGFFARLSPRLDAVEEVTVTTAANGADAAGQGAVQIRFTTRSGSNKLAGSGYYYLRHDALNANTWFNNRDLDPDPKTGKAPKTELRQYQPGMRIGGPIVIPGLFDGHDKAFFFVNYEETRSPSKQTLNRTILNPLTQAGNFRYSTTGGGTQSVDLFALAARNGQISTPDPTVAKLLTDIRSATATTGSINDLADPNLQQYTFQIPTNGYTPAPTVRLDYNLSKNHRLTGSFNYQHINSNPDTTNNQQVAFPGFSIYGTQQSTRYSTSEALRSTIGANLVNELRVGATGGATFFSPEKEIAMWSNTGNFHFALNGAGLSNAGATPTPSSREASTKNIEDTLTWLRGTHSLSIGGSWTQADLWLKSQTLVPTVNFGIATGDTADAMFTTANFPGASTTQLNAARAMYSLLVGRVSSIAGNARLDVNTNEYAYMGQGLQEGRMRELGFFVQDAWRWKPNLTINYGLRYELQLPFYPLNNSYATATVADVCGVSGIDQSTGICNVFKPGVLTGQKPTFKAFESGTYAYKTDYNNFAPSLGLSWVPKSSGTGVLGRLLGKDGDTVLRAGYALAYERHGMSDFSDVYATNPGITLSANRDTATNTLNQDGLGLPVLFR
ncbi:MAG TPA: TonB-dependent receptor, partial [Vicinamibacterales bacterium]